MLRKLSTGKALTFRVNYSSNVTYPLDDLTCYVEIPDDFEFLYSQPKGMDNTQWDIPVLNEGGAGKIEISGILSGQSMEQKVFKARIGVWQDGNFILLKEVIKGVQIVAPALYITQKVNNDDNYMASPGDQLHYEVISGRIGLTTPTERPGSSGPLTMWNETSWPVEPSPTGMILTSRPGHGAIR